MTRTQNMEDHILNILSQAPCSLDELVSACPDASWGQIFGEVDRLSRAGRLTLQRRERSTYIISTSNHQGGRHEHAGTMGTV